MSHRYALRRVGRFGPVLVVAAVAGYLLGACGGGDGSALTGSGPTGTRPALTGTRPAETVVTTVTNTETETTEVTTSETTSEPPPPPPPPPPDATTSEPASEASEGAAWALILVGLAVAAALLIGGLLIARRRRGRAATAWSSRLGDLTQRSLVALDDVLAQGSVVTGRIQALAAEAGSLETQAPDDASRRSAGRLRARLDDLAGTLETDRTLRLSSPPPSPEQLSYSTALIRQQVGQLQGVLRPPPPGPPPA